MADSPTGTPAFETSELREILKEFQQEAAFKHYLRVAAVLAGVALLAFTLWWTPPRSAPPPPVSDRPQTTQSTASKLDSALTVVAVGLIVSGLFRRRASLEQRALIALTRTELRRADPKAELD